MLPLFQHSVSEIATSIATNISGKVFDELAECGVNVTLLQSLLNSGNAEAASKLLKSAMDNAAATGVKKEKLIKVFLLLMTLLYDFCGFVVYCLCYTMLLNFKKKNSKAILVVGVVDSSVLQKVNLLLFFVT